MFCFFLIFSEFEGVIKFGLVSCFLCNKIVVLFISGVICYVGWFVGVFFMICCEVLDDIGFFDESFFFYFEEIDFCLCVVFVGYKMIYVCESVVIYIGFVFIGMKIYKCMLSYWFDSCFYYFFRNYGCVYMMVVMFLYLVGGSFVRC